MTSQNVLINPPRGCFTVFYLNNLSAACRWLSSSMIKGALWLVKYSPAIMNIYTKVSGEYSHSSSSHLEQVW